MDFSVLHNDVRLAFDQDAEEMWATRDPRKQPVKEDQDKPTSDGREKRRAPIHGAGQDRRQSHDQHGIKHSLLRQRAFAAEANHKQSRIDDDDAAQWDLNKRQVLRFEAKAQPHLRKMRKRIHVRDFTIPAGHGETITSAAGVL